jgi:hypothetical protein
MDGTSGSRSQVGMTGQIQSRHRHHTDPTTTTRKEKGKDMENITKSNISPTHYTDLSPEVREKNLVRLSSQKRQEPPYYAGRRKGVELALTLERGEFEYIGGNFITAEELADGNDVMHDALFMDPVIAPYMQAEYEHMPHEYAADSSGRADVYLVAFQTGLVEAIRDAYNQTGLDEHQS